MTIRIFIIIRKGYEVRCLGHLGPVKGEKARVGDIERCRVYRMNGDEIGLTVKEYMFTILGSVEELFPLLHSAVITI